MGGLGELIRGLEGLASTRNPYSVTVTPGLYGFGFLSGDETAWRPAVEELRDGVWVRNWTGNYNFRSSDDAKNFVKQTFGEPPSAALKSDKSTYRIVAEQKATTTQIQTPTDAVVETRTGTAVRPTEPPKTEVTTTPSIVMPPPITQTTTPDYPASPSQPAVEAPGLQYEGAATEPSIGSQLNNLPLIGKLGLAAGIIGAIGAAVYFGGKKRR